MTAHPPYGSSPGTPAPPPQPRHLPPHRERHWAVAAHGLGLLGPLPALLIHLAMRDRGPFIRAQSTEALNFQITVLIGYLGATVMEDVLATLLGLPLRVTWAVWLASAVFSVLAAVAASRGENHRYPWSLRILP